MTAKKTHIANGWILYKKDQEDYEVQRLKEEFEKVNIKINVYKPNDIDVIVDKDNKRSIIVNGEYIKELPNFVFPRTGSGTNYHTSAVLRHLEKMSITTINNNSAINLVKDKLHSQQVFAAADLPVPKTMLVRHPVDIDMVVKNIGFPIVIKTLSGSFGTGVVLVNDKKEFSNFIKWTEVTNKNHNIILQEFIKDSHGRDLRVIVIGGRVVGCILRKSTTDDFRANITIGGEAEEYKTTREIEWISLEASRLCDLDVSGVDLLFDGEHFKICEINSAPGFKGYEEYTDKNIAKELVDYICIKIGILK